MASITWFRMYHEARNDAKLHALSDAQHRTWFRLLCLASEQPQRGVISGLSSGLLAIEVCQGDTELLGSTLAILTDPLRIVTVQDEVVTFINFPKRQYNSPSDHPEKVSERVARHRRNRANGNANELETVVGVGSSYINGAVTSVKRGVTKTNETDTDSDTDTEKERMAPVGAVLSEPKVAKPKSEDRRMWDAFVEALEAKPETTSERGKWNRGIKELRDSGITPADVHGLVAKYRLAFKSVPCNPRAIANNLTEVRGAPELPPFVAESLTETDARLERERAAVSDPRGENPWRQLRSSPPSGPTPMNGRPLAPT